MFKEKIFAAVICWLTLAGSSSAVLVDGTCLLENQTNHEGTRVLFKADSLGAITDSAFTDASGYYQKDLYEGSYSLFFNHPGFVDAMILGQHFFAPVTLPDITLLVPPPGVCISDTLSGTLDDTTYVITGNITVTAGDSLIVPPGAVFYFIGDYDINIYGYFAAVGSETDSIYFLSASDDLYWGSIIFRTGSSFQSELSYCRISGAGGSAVNCYSVDITISHCTISDNIANWGGGIYCSYANPIISDCIITNNQCVNNGGGIYSTHCSPRIINCLIAGNASNMYGGGSGRGGGGICANHSSSPLIQNCTISENHSNHNGGGISINDNSHAQIIESLITQNESDSSGGGIFCASYCNAVIENCEIANNTALTGGGLYVFACDSLVAENCMINGNIANNYGGGIQCELSNSVISRCLLEGNSSLNTGGGISCFLSSPSIMNCTLSGNSATSYGGGLYSTQTSSPSLVNTIVEGSSGIFGVYLNASPDAVIQYGDYYNNGAMGNFGGESLPTGLGIINTVNANGDSCDAFFNIFCDPLFYATAGDSAFHLSENSPCIDAGDPLTPLDPDSTIADIGAFYFNQGILSAVSIVLNPLNPPVIIPETGGSFDFNVELTNNTNEPVNFDAWIMVQLPNSTWYGPVLGPVNLTLPAILTIERNRTQNVPEIAPAGTYTYEGRVGVYPDDIRDADFFTFEKLGSTVGIPGGKWFNTGEEFDFGQNLSGPVILQKFALLSAFPNPFNPTTNIRFELSSPEYVTIEIFDTSGRRISRLIQGLQIPGSHEVAFDASGFSSGVYFIKLSTNNQNFCRKIVLMK